MVPSPTMPTGAARGLLRLLPGLLLSLVLVAGCSGDGGDPVRAALEIVPASTLERTVLVSLGEVSEGFGTVLPAGALPQLLGMESDQVHALAETGGAPLTVVLGDLDADAAVDTAQQQGYRAREIRGWWALRPSDEATGPLPAAVPAAAVRDGAAVLGSAAEVAAVVDGAPDAASVDWVRRLLSVLGENDRAIAFGEPSLIESAIEVAEEPVPPPPPDAPPLRPYEGFALAWTDALAGRILLARPAGDVTTEDAAALALRTSTGTVLGGGRLAADVVEGGGPRIDEESGVVALPVAWLDAPAELRADIEQGRLAFLAPR